MTVINIRLTRRERIKKVYPIYALGGYASQAIGKGHPFLRIQQLYVDTGQVLQESKLGELLTWSGDVLKNTQYVQAFYDALPEFSIPEPSLVLAPTTILLPLVPLALATYLVRKANINLMRQDWPCGKCYARYDSTGCGLYRRLVASERERRRTEGKPDLFEDMGYGVDLSLLAPLGDSLGFAPRKSKLRHCYRTWMNYNLPEDAYIQAPVSVEDLPGEAEVEVGPAWRLLRNLHDRNDVAIEIPPSYRNPQVPSGIALAEVFLPQDDRKLSGWGVRMDPTIAKQLLGDDTTGDRGMLPLSITITREPFLEKVEDKMLNLGPDWLDDILRERFSERFR